MLIRFWSAVVVISLMGLVAACSPSAPAEVAPEMKAPAQPAKVGWEQEWQKIVEDAKKEKEVLIYTTSPSGTRLALSEGFKTRFGIELQWVSATPAEIVRKILAERTAGLYLADGVITGASTMLFNLKPEGVLQPIEPMLKLPEVRDGKAWRGEKVPFLGKDTIAVQMIAQYQRFLARNTDIVRPGEITSMRDLLKPQWKGKFVMYDPGVAGDGNLWFAWLATKVWGPEQTREFMQQLARQEIAIVRDKRLTSDWLARGKYPLAQPNLEVMAEFINAGAPIELIKTSEGGVIGGAGGYLSVTQKPAHPNGAVVFLNWMLSKEGQATFVKGSANPSIRTDAPREGIPALFFPDPGEKYDLEDEEINIMKPKIWDMSKEILSSLVMK
ncbi:MAG: extracellular solute-binding protein [Chloroflexi bacterium]|nr:extracellular solute-binding protein [Chloroflexota bacterium]